MKKSTLLVSVIAWEIVVLITFLFWWTVVPLNINLTQEFLKAKINIKYYEDSLPWGLANPAFTSQFGVYWVGFLTDLLRLISPITVFLTLSYIEKKDIEFLILGMIILHAIIFGFEIIKVFLRGWQLWFCENFQICRNWNPTNCHPKFNCPPNYAFWWSFVYTVFWVFVALITMLALGTFLAYAYKQEQLRKATAREYLRNSQKDVKNRLTYSQINDHFKEK